MGLAVLLVVGLGALYLLLPGWIDSPAVRQRIEESAREATGRDFHYEKLSFGLIPPRLVVESPSLSGETPADPPFAEAREVSLKIALLPLLQRTLLLENLVVEEATVRLVRDGSGLRLPEREKKERKPRGEGEGGPNRDDDEGVDLAVQEVALRDARILFEDRTVSPASTLEIEALNVTAVLSPTEPTRVDLDAKLGGGSVELEGSADLLAKQSEWTASLDGIALDLLAPYLGEGRSVAGALSGTVAGKGEPASPDLSADLAVSEGVFQIRDVKLRGPLAIRADLAGGEQRSGTFDIDATGAALDAYDGVFQKPAGKPGSVKGRFVPKGDGDFEIDDVEIKIHNLDARGRIEVGRRVQAELAAGAFDLAGWDTILPALAEYQLTGTLRPGTLRLATEPLAVRGRIGLDGVKLVLPDGPEIALQGAVEGTGDALKLVDLALTTGGETVRLRR
ncbi:MAG: DUF748 domain-containing protein [Deltaproteobacteria bacterium]|nr:DUF748 domain-containing protein [Deltaproteobacteria bacterium]